MKKVMLSLVGISSILFVSTGLAFNPINPIFWPISGGGIFGPF